MSTTRGAELRQQNGPATETEIDYERFYEENWLSLRRYLRSRCGDYEMANDVMQQAFVVALDRWEAVRIHAKPEGWLFVTADKLLSRALKKARREPCDENVQDTAAPPEPYLLIDDSMTVEWLLGQLPPRESQVVYLCVMHGFTEIETAQILNVARNTVKSYKRTGLQRLQEMCLRLEQREGAAG